jgi:hypothetical protein
MMMEERPLAQLLANRRTHRDFLRPDDKRDEVDYLPLPPVERTGSFWDLEQNRPTSVATLRQ